MSEDYRQVALATKGDNCVACGTTEDVIVHHLDGDRSNNHIDNLVPMCRSCHGAVHSGAEGYEEWTQHLDLDEPLLPPVTAREHDTFYLSGDVRAELTRRYRRVTLDVLEETGVDIDDQAIGGRNRYFRPLALLVGARELEDKSPAELRETIEGEALVDDLPEPEE